MPSSFSVLLAGDQDKEDLCRRTVSQYHHRRCEALLRPIWKGTQISHLFVAMTLSDKILPVSNAGIPNLKCHSNVMVQQKQCPHNMPRVSSNQILVKRQKGKITLRFSHALVCPLSYYFKKLLISLLFTIHFLCNVLLFAFSTFNMSKL